MKAGITMKRLLTGLITVLLFIAVGVGVYSWQQTKVQDLSRQKDNLQAQVQQAKEAASKQPNYSYKSDKGVNITVYTPLANIKVSSPLVIIGQVPGNWSFEAQFVIQLKDANGKVIGQTPATLQGDWMTEALVPFTATLEFPASQSGVGTLVLVKDNPSDLPQNNDSLKIPTKY